MLINDHTSLQIAVGRFVRLLYVASLITIITGLAVVACEINFSSTTRTWLVLVFVLPAFSLLFAVYMQEGQFAEPLLRRRFYVSVVVSLLGILLPSIFLVCRYLLPSSVTEIVTWLARGFLIAMFLLAVSILFGYAKSGNGISYFLLFVHAVMWEHWGGETGDRRGCQTFDDIDVKEVGKRRARCYVEKGALKLFQGSLTCQKIESDIVSRLVMEQDVPDKLSVLDIGGGEGLFTLAVLRSLKEGGCSISDLVMYDPVDWDSEYRKNVSSVIPEPIISVKRKGFDRIEENRQFDLVLASHSLYAAWDCPKGNWMSVQEKSDRLLGLAKPEGIVVVTMASARSPAYHFKKRAIQHIFGVEIEDVTVEAFAKDVSEKVRAEQYMDNLIDLTSLIRDYREGGDKLYLWLSYFLRCNMAKLRRADRACLINILLNYVYPLETLPERELQRWLKCESPVLGREADVLMHKTKALVLRR